MNADVSFDYGSPDDKPVMRDWNNDRVNVILRLATREPDANLPKLFYY